MKTTSTFRAAAAAAFLVLQASSMMGCKKEAPPVAPVPAPVPAPLPSAPPAVTVAGITLGKLLGPDKKVASPIEVMGPKDTIYASIETTGVGKATVLKAKWTFADTKGGVVPVNEETQTVDLDGPAVHEFHISKKSPWPKGSYTVEVFLNDKPAASKKFTVN